MTPFAYSSTLNETLLTRKKGNSPSASFSSQPVASNAYAQEATTYDHVQRAIPSQMSMGQPSQQTHRLSEQGFGGAEFFTDFAADASINYCGQNYRLDGQVVSPSNSAPLAKPDLAAEFQQQCRDELGFDYSEPVLASEPSPEIPPTPRAWNTAPEIPSTTLAWPTAPGVLWTQSPALHPSSQDSGAFINPAVVQKSRRNSELIDTVAASFQPVVRQRPFTTSFKSSETTVGGFPPVNYY